MRILFIVGRELEYQRNDVLLRAFQRFSDVEIIGSHQRPESLILNSFIIFSKVLPKILFSKYDKIFVGFYGNILMLPVGLLARSPVIFDAFLSTYDTLVFDRKMFDPNSKIGRLAYWLDRTACNMADHVFLDTPQHIDYFVETFNIGHDKFDALPVGCNEDIFYPQPLNNNNEFRVLFYTTYLPIHGVDTVIQAAALLEVYKNIRFRIIGDGIEYPRIRNLAEKTGLTNVEFLSTIPLIQLPSEIAQADICLGGHFQNSEKAERVIPGKIYQILAMARPLIAADTSANRSLLTHGKDAYLCSPADPDSLAEAIRRLYQDSNLREILAKNGYLLYERFCSENVITQKLEHILNNIYGAMP